ncbi:hypothetical protein RGU70_04400 [Herbaspirillum sp. RTI4]|uniref:hypothetical protein n=1 Tax=Herbaspirillum sp. RTI4 TaxID=3048640 RepID=UPI002AB53BFD|nr:hypothetical protein [Herbaspirillum sp. RTI4]MDY7577561.1 hypothetical protein [Herbaspirillum sp. RTI4]MEA9981036.1 hypothetical protein [Herbaspirillum sp. RTI4]
MTMKDNTTIWLFGRGLSCNCGLTWTVPDEWKTLPREQHIKQIKTAIRCEMNKPTVNTSCIRRLLDDLATQTPPGHQHHFGTTNWDYLLQREMPATEKGDIDCPEWLVDSHVSHLNGTTEELTSNQNRSPFLLQEDVSSERKWTVEANKFYVAMTNNRRFVVAGMSFECETDKFLMQALGKVKDDLPIGDSTWLVINNNSVDLTKACIAISTSLPHSNVIPVQSGFSEWQDDEYPYLWGMS